MRGIYKITIDDAIYIGKDSRIDLNKKLKAHLNLLNKNSISRIRSIKYIKNSIKFTIGFNDQ